MFAVLLFSLTPRIKEEMRRDIHSLFFPSSKKKWRTFFFLRLYWEDRDIPINNAEFPFR